MFNKKKSLGLNAFLNGIRSILSLIFPLITFPYVSRVLGANGIGKYNFSSSIVSYFILIAGLGINTYATREGARYRDQPEKLKEFANEIFSINLISTVLSYVLLVVSLFIFNRLQAYVMCILILSLQIFFTTLGTEWLYTIFEDFAYITYRSICFNIISIVLLFIFVKNDTDYLNYAAITVFASVGSNILNFINARKFVKLSFTFKFDWRRHLVPILVIFGINITSMIYVSSDITILGILKTPEVVGYYSVSSKIYSMVKSFLSSVLAVTIPRFSLYLGQKKIKEYNILLQNIVNILILITCPTMVGLFLLSKQAVLIISGPEYIRAVTSLQILCFAFLFDIFAEIITDCILLPKKHENQLLISMLSSAVINIILNFWLIPKYSENAAAFSTVIAQLVMLIFNVVFSINDVKKIYISKQSLKNFVESMLGCIGIIIIVHGCTILCNNLVIQIVMSILFSGVVYIIVLILVKNEVIIDFFNKTIKHK